VADALKGKVTLVDFWTYSCINCLRSLPYVRAWADKYNASGLVVLGVHTPEFSFERDVANVETAVHELGVTYPVAIDNNYTIWSAFNNAAWPAHYLIDARGHIRYRQWGEGEYRETERAIQQLLSERNGTPAPPGFVRVNANGAEAAADSHDVRSPETVLGSPSITSSSSDAQPDGSKLYAASNSLSLNQWGVTGRWLVQGERVVLVSAPGSIVFRFHARDLHLVLGASAKAAPIRFCVKLDGHPPGADHGVDTDDQGYGTVHEHRLYQLLRQKRGVDDRTFEIEFLDPGIQAFSFTFG
jgi:thiol-disulfide isomerase/thioredoxin